MSKVWKLFLASLAAGARSLASPKGFLSFLAFVVSIAAYLRSSIETTHLFVVLNEPILVEEVAEQDQDGDWHMVDAGIRSFEFLVTSSGQHTVYLSDLRIALFPNDPLADVWSDCSVLLSPTSDDPSSRRQIRSLVLAAEPLSEAYPYKGKSGFIVHPKDTIPFRGTIFEDRNQGNIERLSTAWNATFIPRMNSDLRELLLDAKVEPAVCLAGSVVASGLPPMRFLWSSLKSPEDLSVVRGFSQEAAPPVAPGGKFVPAQMTYSLSVGGGLFTGQQPFITLKNLNILGIW